MITSGAKTAKEKQVFVIGMNFERGFIQDEFKILCKVGLFPSSTKRGNLDLLHKVFIQDKFKIYVKLA